ncbi:MAG TPA: threonine/serine dehydratase [Gammaproteobacteria bacterium]|nr:threonine/serine dehydratase [Gammaproteobacteria bacterium]
MVAYEDIVRARETISGTLRETPCLRIASWEESFGRPLWFKAELFQRTGSFKPRGALNWIRNADADTLARGLLTVSAGNHARALAWAARDAGADLTVVMPEAASPIKVEATRAYGAGVILHGEINEALAKTEEIRREEGRTLVHPYDDPRVIAGQGTVGLEILEQLPDVDTVACPIGGGGLISGIGLALKHHRPEIRLIGVEPAAAPTLGAAWEHGGPCRLESARTIAASLGAATAGELCYRISREVVDGIVTLGEEDIVRGARSMITRGKLYAEPGGAIAASALLSGAIPLREDERAGAVISGGNLDPATLHQLL